MSEQGDPIDILRQRLVAEDERIVAAFNRRLELVGELKRVKAQLEVAFLDPDRERWLQHHLTAVSDGPVSSAGLEELVSFLLDLSKREVAGL